jgi:hypothetical protein
LHRHHPSHRWACGTGITRRTSRADCTGITRRTSRASCTGITCGAGRASCTGITCRASWACGTGSARRTGGTRHRVQRVLRHRRGGDRLPGQGRAIHRDFEIELGTGERARERQIDAEQPADDREILLADRAANLVAAGFGVVQAEAQVRLPGEQGATALESPLVDEVGQLRGLGLDLLRVGNQVGACNAEAQGDGEEHTILFHDANPL